ncbi:MAG: glycosyltransferase, partial [bacterium]|nr:glycosyltransferase [bacterium]
GIDTSLLRERFRFDPAIVAQFRRLLAQYKPDLYQSHGYKGSVFGRIARRQGVAWQAIFHGFTWENWRVRLYHALDVRLMRGAGEVVVVSRAFEKELARRGIDPRRLRWIPNAIAEDALRSTRSDITRENLRRQWFGKGGEDGVLVGVVGRFSPEKAPDFFLDAFGAAAARRPDLKAVMVGDGILLDECRRRASGGALAGRVALPGFRADLASIYEALDMLVIPSRSEGLPTVLLEAMLMGVPVVSTRVGAVPDVAREGREALLVPIENREALAEAILRLAEDAELGRRLSRGARELVERRLTVARRTATLLDHARCLIEGRALPAAAWEE